LILHAISSGSHHLIRIQLEAHFPVPTIIAVGVASPSAQGQAITITAEKYRRLVAKLAQSKKYQIRKVIIAIIITTGTKIADILSANHWIGAFDH